MFFFFFLCRFSMPTRGSAGRRQTWRQSLRVTRPTVSHTKVTNSSPRCIISLQTVRPAPSLCGMFSNHLRLWSAVAATSSATRTISTKRRTSLLLAKVTRQESVFFPVSLVIIAPQCFFLFTKQPQGVNLVSRRVKLMIFADNI